MKTIFYSGHNGNKEEVEKLAKKLGFSLVRFSGYTRFNREPNSFDDIKELERNIRKTIKLFRIWDCATEEEILRADKKYISYWEEIK
jgi:hypothetical protein